MQILALRRSELIARTLSNWLAAGCIGLADIDAATAELLQLSMLELLQVMVGSHQMREQAAAYPISGEPICLN